MSKWRPARACTYVIPDIHGRYDCLRAICKRILPLRKDDRLILLGDYIDRGPDSAKVIEYLIELKSKYKDNIIPLLGNHEWFVLASLKEVSYIQNPLELSPFAMWMQNGGAQTVLSYAAQRGLKIDNTFVISQNRVRDFIPQSHIDFMLNETYLMYETENYIFVHAGCDPNKAANPADSDVYLWDRSLYHTAKKLVKAGKKLPWEKTIVLGHSSDGPWINDKLMMLDCLTLKKLLVVELNSREAFMASPGNTRLERIDLDSYKPIPAKSIFRRVDG